MTDDTRDTQPEGALGPETAPEPQAAPPAESSAPVDRVALEPSATTPQAPPATQAPPGEMPPHLEAAYRKLSRRALVAVTLVLLIVFASAGYIGTHAISRRFEGARKLDEAQRLLERADTVVIALDEVVRGQLSADLAERAGAIRSDLPGATEDLKRAIDLIDQANDSVTENEQKSSMLLRDAAVARLDMLGPADAILEANAKAGTSLDPAKQGWALVLSAEKTADEAVAEYNKLTKESVTKSGQLSAQADAKLKDARSYFSEAATAFPEAGFDKYLAFIDGKIALIGISQQSNAAWLAGRVADANALIAAYNTEEQKVIVAAKALPATPANAVADAYERLVKAKTDAYFEARKAATKADAALDSY